MEQHGCVMLAFSERLLDAFKKAETGVSVEAGEGTGHDDKIIK